MVGGIQSKEKRTDNLGGERKVSEKNAQVRNQASEECLRGASFRPGERQHLLGRRYEQGNDKREDHFQDIK